MTSIWRSLAWKEWNEHKWKLVALVATMCGVMIPALWDHSAFMLVGVQAVLLCTVLPLAMFIGWSAAAGERSRGTLAFLQALPVPMWRAALQRFLFGLGTVLVPIVVTTLLVYAWCRFLDLRGIDYSSALKYSEQDLIPIFGTDSLFLHLGLMASLIGISFYVWSAAAGVNSKDEVSAAALSLVLMIGWWVLLLTFWTYLYRGAAGDRGRVDWLEMLGIATGVGGLGAIAELSQHQREYIWLGLAVAAISHLLLTLWYIGRYGRARNAAIRSRQTAAINNLQPDWLGTPRKSPLSATVWKQLRESAPFALAGLAGIAGITALIVMIDEFNIRNTPQVLTAITAYIGSIIALGLGIGTFFGDFKPRLHTFWRSRPIQPDLWYAAKFLTGLGLLVAMLALPISAAIWLVWQFDSTLHMDHSEVLVIACLQLAIYASAAAMTCLVRRAVYAAILSMAVVYIGVVIVWLISIFAAVLGWIQLRSFAFTQMSTDQVAIGMMLAAAVATVFGWLAVRNDWGWKG